MAALMPGWQRAPGWALSNKIYLSPGEASEREVLPGTPKEDIHTYEVKFNKTINLYISPGDVIEITRILEDNVYKEERVVLYRNQIDGGLDEWIEALTKELCNTNWDRANFEVGGGFIRGDDFCKIEITYKKYTPPKPKFTPIELARAKEMIKNLEEAAERLPYAREDLLKRANELREKYGLVGVQL